MEEEKKKPEDSQPQATEPEQTAAPQNSVLIELRTNIILLQRALYTADMRSSHRITQTCKRFKKCMKPHYLKKVWGVFFPQETQINWEEFPEFVRDYDEPFEFSKGAAAKIIKYQEIEVYLYIIFLIYLIRLKKYDRAYQIVEYLYSIAKTTNKRSFDYLNSYIYYYLSLLKEQEEVTRKNSLLQIREDLLQAYRASCLRHDEIGQSSLLNLLLRNYLHYNHYEAANHLIDKCQFPENKSNNEYVRFLYYVGRISAVKLEYSDSLSSLNQAIRRSPDNTALGFRIEAQKLAIVVELLLGDIPSRDIFTQQELEKALIPYYKLVQSVNKGNLLDFKNIVAQYEKQYIDDKLYTLIQRLHQVVIKTGLRKINASYSQISFQDIATQLNLPSGTDVEFMIAKAIRDGVLMGTINHDGQFVEIDDKQQFYTSTEPQASLIQRIDFCVNLENKAIQSLQFPHSQYKNEELNNDSEYNLGLLEEDF